MQTPLPEPHAQHCRGRFWPWLWQAASRGSAALLTGFCPVPLPSVPMPCPFYPYALCPPSLVPSFSCLSVPSSLSRFPSIPVPVLLALQPCPTRPIILQPCPLTLPSCLICSSSSSSSSSLSGPLIPHHCPPVPSILILLSPQPPARHGKRLQWQTGGSGTVPCPRAVGICLSGGTGDPALGLGDPLGQWECWGAWSFAGGAGLEPQLCCCHCQQVPSWLCASVSLPGEDSRPQ